MEPFEAYLRLRLAIPKRPELRFPSWPDVPWKNLYGDAYSWLTPYKGACQIASQVFCHLVQGATLWLCPSPCHYWSVLDGQIWDATADQFSKLFDYSKGLEVTSWTLEPRTQALLDDCLAIHLSNLEVQV